MKRIIGMLTLATVVLLLSSCGVPQKDYDKVSTDLAAAKREIQSLETQLSVTKSQLQTTNKRLADIRAKIEVLTDFVIPSLKGDTYKMTSGQAVNFLFEWATKIDSIGDPLLTRKFQVLMAAWSEETLDSFYTYLREAILKTLE